MKALRAVALLFSLSSYVLGQQLLTTVNPAGATVVEQITTNAFGQPLTQTLQTLGQGISTTTTGTSLTTSPTTTTPTTTNTRTTTTPPNQQGPIAAQPNTTPVTPGGPTPYTYTTTDANGNYITQLGTFTPSFTTIPTIAPTMTGTILQYSEWLSHIGTNTGDLNQPVASQAANPASRAIVDIRVLLTIVLPTVLLGVLGGGWVLIL